MPRIEFKGKSSVANLHFAVPYHALVPDAKKGVSKSPSLEDNLIIHGDNLKALKALLPTYAGRVKCIYIDPPYNTGNEHWVYNDNVNSPMMREWLGKVVDSEDLTRHDKWLCMMMPRLKLLRELLTHDGTIFVSIDDNEQHHLRMLMNEVFGEENFLANIAWEKRYTRSNNAKLFYSLKDSILVYRRTDSVNLLKEPRLEKTEGIYANPDDDPRGDWTSASYVNPATKEQRPNLVYAIRNPQGKSIEHPTHAWKFSLETHAEHVAENRLWWGKDGKARYPRLKIYRNDTGVVPVDLWGYQETGTTDEGGNVVKEIFGKAIFDNPKPVRLIERILKLVTNVSSTDIILDSFAGSGTTAHAVLALNKEDGGQRRFILVETEDYADKITAERVRRVIKGVKNAKDENLRNGLGGTFSYFELGGAFDVNKMLTGEALPSYEELARYVFHNATGQTFDAKKINRQTNFIGATENLDIYLIYEPDIEKLKGLALSLDTLDAMGPAKAGRQRLVFAPAKYLDREIMDEHNVEFAQLPFDIFKKFFVSESAKPAAPVANKEKKKK